MQKEFFLRKSNLKNFKKTNNTNVTSSRYFVILFILFLVSLHSQAQTTIKGKVTGTYNETLPYAIIAYSALNDSIDTGVVTSDSTGLFTLTTESLPIVIRTSYLSYATSEIICKDNKYLHITLQPDTLSLREVVVKGKKPKVRLTNEGVITNITGTTLGKLGNAEDVLLHMPMIHKKGDEIEVFGKGTPTIYINGIEMRDDKELRQLKSTDIKDIELILNPGSRYNASSTSVIKIKTIKKKDNGLSFVFSGTYGKGKQHKDNTELETEINYTLNKWELFSSLWFDNEGSLQDATINQSASNNNSWSESINMGSRFRNRYGQIVVGFNYTGDSVSTGMKYSSYVPLHSNGLSSFNNNMMVNGDDYDQLTNSTSQRTIPKLGHRISAYYNAGWRKTNVDMNVDFLNDGYDTNSSIDELSKANDARMLTTLNSVRNTLIATKISLSTPMLGGEFNIGTEDSYTNRKDRYENAQGYVATANGRFHQTSLAFYTGFSYNFNFLQLDANVRYENVNYTYKDVNKVHKVFNNFFPSFSLSTNIGKVNLNVSYSSRISRPSYRQLSNDVTYASMYSLQTGYPILDNTIIKDVSLTMNWKFMQFNLDYMIKHHDIINYSYPVSENSYVLMTTFRNIPCISTLMPTFVVSPQIGIWNPELTVGFMKQWVKTTEYIGDYSFEKPIWDLELSNNFESKNGWLAVIGFGFQTKGNYQNTYIFKNTYDLNFSISKTLLKDKLNIKLSAEDILNHDNDTSTMYCPNVTLSQANKYYKRRVLLTIRYTFNVKKSKYKGSGAGNSEINRL